MIITLHGRVPSKKNSKQIVPIGTGANRRWIMVPSKKYKEWQTEQLKNLATQFPHHQTISTIESISLLFYAPDKIRADLTNKAESIMDLLVDAGILADDNWFLISAIYLKMVALDRVDPRVEITIETSHE